MRARLLPVATATLVAFAAAVAAPSVGFLVHRHAGGDHAHRHGDGRGIDTGDREIDLLLAEALGTQAADTHRYGSQHLENVGFDSPGHSHADPAHWHSESPFQLAVSATAPALAGLHLVAQAELLVPPLPGSTPAARTRARSPPLLA
jgi:hypothetical protein